MRMYAWIWRRTFYVDKIQIEYENRIGECDELTTKTIIRFAAKQMFKFLDFSCKSPHFKWVAVVSHTSTKYTMDEKMVFMNQADFVLRFCGAVEQNEFIEPYFVTTLNLMTKDAIKFGRGPQICFVEAHEMKSNSHQSKDDLWTELSTNNSYLIQAQPSQANWSQFLSLNSQQLRSKWLL